MFLTWAARNDYLSANHRLFEADGMAREIVEAAEIRLLHARANWPRCLASADDTLRPVIAVGGLAGLRSAEMMRLDWADVWRVPGHIEITAGKSQNPPASAGGNLPGSCRRGLNRIASANVANSGRVKNEHFW